MNIQVQRRPKALDEGHRAALVGSLTPGSSNTPTKLCEQRTEKCPQHLAGELRVVGTAIAKGVGERQHPLPDRDLWEDAIHQVRSGVRHAPSTAGGAEATSLAREGEQAVVAAVVAVKA